MIVYIVTNTINGKQYVGKTVQTLAQRWLAHVKDAKAGKSSAFHRAIRKYGKEAFTRRVFYTGTSDADIIEVERQTIALFGTRSPNGYNLTDGGEGLSGYKFTPEQKARHRNSLNAPEVKARIGAAGKAAWANPEYAERMRAAMKAAQTKPETKARKQAAWTPERRAATKAAWANPEYAAWRRAALRGAKTPELIEQHRARMADPAVKERLRAATKASHADPEITQRRLNGMKAAWTPERRAAQAKQTAERNRARAAARKQQSEQQTRDLPALSHEMEVA